MRRTSHAHLFTFPRRTCFAKNQEGFAATRVVGPLVRRDDARGQQHEGEEEACEKLDRSTSHGTTARSEVLD